MSRRLIPVSVGVVARVDVVVCVRIRENCLRTVPAVACVGFVQFPACGFGPWGVVDVGVRPGISVVRHMSCVLTCPGALLVSVVVKVGTFPESCVVDVVWGVVRSQVGLVFFCHCRVGLLLFGLIVGCDVRLVWIVFSRLAS